MDAREGKCTKCGALRDSHDKTISVFLEKIGKLEARNEQLQSYIEKLLSERESS
jgi:hypothetical protein